MKRTQKGLDFEKCFGEFIDRREYDKAENALFSMVRIAFVAGWLAAGGDPPKAQKVLTLVHKEIKEQPTYIDSELLGKLD